MRKSSRQYETEYYIQNIIGKASEGSGKRRIQKGTLQNSYVIKEGQLHQVEDYHHSRFRLHHTPNELDDEIL